MTTQHDERAELPPLPEIDPHSHPEPRTFKWTENEIDWIKEYAHKYACTALLAADSRAGGEVVAYIVPTANAMQDGSMEDGPDYLEWADEASEYEKKIGMPLYTRPAPAEPQAVAHWQPIETAPKDGTVILVTDTFTYRSDPEKKPHHVYRAVRWNEEGYGWEIYNDGEIIDQDGPTFWMPLPAEPGSMLSASPAAPAEREPQAAPEYLAHDPKTHGRHDPLYANAVAVVRQRGKGSISIVQHHLRIGYNRAACMVEDMVGTVLAHQPPCDKLLPDLCIACKSEGRCMKRQALCYANGTAQKFKEQEK